MHTFIFFRSHMWNFIVYVIVIVILWCGTVWNLMDDVVMGLSLIPIYLHLTIKTYILGKIRTCYMILRMLNSHIIIQKVTSRKGENPDKIMRQSTKWSVNLINWRIVPIRLFILYWKYGKIRYTKYLHIQWLAVPLQRHGPKTQWLNNKNKN